MEQIVIAYWRLARVHRCEAGEIAKNSESAEYRFDDWQRQTVADYDPHLMRRSSKGLETFSATLDLVELELKRSSGSFPIRRSHICFVLDLKYESSSDFGLWRSNNSIRKRLLTEDKHRSMALV